MISFIARHFSSVWALISAPFRAIWDFIIKIFPPRDCSIMDTASGNVYTYQQSSFWRFTKFCVLTTMFLWASWSTYVFIYHRPLLQKRTQQLEESKAQHARQMADLKVYLQKYNDLAHQLNVTDDKILNSEKLSESEKENLINSRLKAWGELDFLQTRIKDMFTNIDYSSEFTKISELTIEYDLIKNENTILKKQNQNIIELSKEISDADSELIKGIEQMISDNTSELTKQMKRISTSLSKLGLSDASLITQANKYSNKIIGNSFNPIKLSKNANAKYQKIAQDIEKWHGLNRLTEILPLGAPIQKVRITSNYGSRKDPFTGKQKTHKGIDFAGKIGTELMAVAPGRVISAGERSGYGITVEIDHGLGFTTLYAHLSKMLVSRGEWIRPGTVVGLGGSSGRSTGPHLHYEIRYKGTPFNPSKFIKE